MRAVVTPGRSEPRAAVARDKARRTSRGPGCQSLPGRGRGYAYRCGPCCRPVGPRLPAWQSPQIQIAGRGANGVQVSCAAISVKLNGTAAHISVRRARHLEVSQLGQVGHTSGGARCFHGITQYRCSGRAVRLGECFIMFLKNLSRRPSPVIPRQETSSFAQSRRTAYICIPRAGSFF